jgi:hypothetical protein
LLSMPNACAATKKRAKTLLISLVPGTLSD